jgi:hypothetical protein
MPWAGPSPRCFAGAIAPSLQYSQCEDAAAMRPEQLVTLIRRQRCRSNSQVSSTDYDVSIPVVFANACAEAPVVDVLR